MFCIAWPDAPFTKLSIAEKITNLFFILVLHTDISQLLVCNTFPEPRGALRFKIYINCEFL